MKSTAVILFVFLLMVPGIAQAEITNSPFNWEVDLTTPVADNPIMGSLVHEGETYIYEKDGLDINYYSTDNGSALTYEDTSFTLEQDSYVLLAQDQEDYLLMNVESKYTGLQEPTAWDFQTDYNPILPFVEYDTFYYSDGGRIDYTTTPYRGYGGSDLWNGGSPVGTEIMGHNAPELYPLFYGPSPPDQEFTMAFTVSDLGTQPGYTAGRMELGLYDSLNPNPEGFIVGADLSYTTTGAGINRFMIKYDIPAITYWARVKVDTYSDSAMIKISVDESVIWGKILDVSGNEIAGLDYTTKPILPYSTDSPINYGEFGINIPDTSSYPYTGYGWRNRIGAGLGNPSTAPIDEFYCKSMGITNGSIDTPIENWDYYVNFDSEGGLDSYQFGDEVYYSAIDQAIVCEEHIPYSPGYISSYTYDMPVSYMVSKDFPGSDPLHMTFKIEDIDLGTSGVIRGGLNNPLDPSSFAGFKLRNNVFEGKLIITPIYVFDIYESGGNDIEIPYDDIYTPAGIDVSSLTIEVLFDDDDIYVYVFDENGERLLFQMYNPITPDVPGNSIYGISAFDMWIGNGNGYWSNIGIGSLWDGHPMLNCKITEISIDSQEYPFTTDALTIRKTSRPLELGWLVDVTVWPPGGFEDMRIVQPEYLNILAIPLEIIKEEDIYYLYSNNGVTPGIDIHSSTDLLTWSHENTVLDDPPVILSSVSMLKIIDDYYLTVCEWDGTYTNLTSYRCSDLELSELTEIGIIWTVEDIVPTVYIHRDDMTLSSFDGSNSEIWGYVSDTTGNTYFISYRDVDYSMGFNPYRREMELQVGDILVFMIVTAVIVGVAVTVKKTVG